MAPVKPRNHVTDQQQAFLSGHDITADLPLLSAEAVEALEAQFRPRCLSRTETAEEHLRYAGKVELVEMLRNRHELWALEASQSGQEEDYVGGADNASTSQQ